MKDFYKKTAILVALVFFLGGIGFCILPFSAVFAEDEYEREDIEDREDEEDEDGDEREEDTEDDSAVKTIAQAETVTTETVTISETQSKEIVTTTKNDKDGDGVFDDDDDYPEINDHFIVKDDDRNGIVDLYEKK